MSGKGQPVQIGTAEGFNGQTLGGHVERDQRTGKTTAAHLPSV
jgi:hypothetical protein